MAGVIGKVVGDYELLELIGDGGQSRVFKARCISRANPQVDFNSIVALKILRSFHIDLILGQRFKQLADALRKTEHAHIVKYHDFFIWPHSDWDEVKCVVMEFLPGETLQERLRRRPAGLSWEEVKSIFNPCLSALVYARALGLTHRDIKPSNIFLGQDGAVKLIDFEVARPEGSGEASLADFKGSPDYMAPDFLVLGDFHGDEISDIFSLGITLYQMLTGRLPFPPLGANAFASYISRWHKQAEVEPAFTDGIFRVLPQASALIRKSLHPARRQRYQTIAEMQAAFQTVQYLIIRSPHGDKYELRQMLGQGGFGEVFLAHRLSDNRRLAVKRLFSMQESPRFIREAYLLKKIRHSHIVEYMDSFIVEEFGQRHYFLIMEYLDGMPGAALRDRLKQQKNGLDANESIELFIHYLEGLHRLHERGIIHRDLKPGNLYAPAGLPENAKIMDLGVARNLRGTITFGQVPGTLDYMAPEFANPDIDRGSRQSDIYSLGLALFEALTGHTAFPKLPKNVSEAYTHFITRKDRQPDLAFNDSVFNRQPEWLAVFQKALAWEPAERFRSADEMRRLLINLLPPGHPKKSLLEAGHPDQPEEFDTEDTGNKTGGPDSDTTQTLKHSDLNRPAAIESPSLLRPAAVKHKSLFTVIVTGLLLVGLAGIYYLMEARHIPDGSNTTLPLQDEGSPAAPRPDISVDKFAAAERAGHLITDPLRSNQFRQSSVRPAAADSLTNTMPAAITNPNRSTAPAKDNIPPEEPREQETAPASLTARRNMPAEILEEQGRLKIVSQQPAAILEGGKTIGMTGNIISNITPGQYVLELKAEGYHPQTLSVTITAGKITNTNALDWSPVKPGFIPRLRM